MQGATISLDLRVDALEEGNGNSSVAELEVRVETLEGTATDHETRISDTEADVTGTLVCEFCCVLFDNICTILQYLSVGGTYVYSGRVPPTSRDNFFFIFAQLFSKMTK